jgi:DNA-binding GntR family transcriptional regulator
VRVVVMVDRIANRAFAGNPPESTKEHKALLRAVRDGDAKTAGVLAAEHADACERAVLDALINSDAVDQMHLG